MNWLVIGLWAVAAWIGYSVLLSIARIGKPREPLTPGGAVAVVIVWTIILAIIVLAALALA